MYTNIASIFALINTHLFTDPWRWNNKKQIFSRKNIEEKSDKYSSTITHNIEIQSFKGFSAHFI